jgi:hypothetical protein
LVVIAMQNSGCTLLDLPPEIILRIAQHSLAPDLLRFRQTCTHVAAATPFHTIAPHVSWNACFKAAAENSGEGVKALARKARHSPADVPALACAVHHLGQSQQKGRLAPIVLALWREHFQHHRTFLDDVHGGVVLRGALQSGAPKLVAEAVSAVAAVVRDPAKMPAAREATLMVALAEWSSQLRRESKDIPDKAPIAELIAACDAAHAPPLWLQCVRFRLQVALLMAPTPPLDWDYRFVDTHPSPLDVHSVRDEITFNQFFVERGATPASVGELANALLDGGAGELSGRITKAELLHALVFKWGHLVEPAAVVQQMVECDLVDCYALLAKRRGWSHTFPESYAASGVDPWNVVSTAAAFDSVGVFSFEVARCWAAPPTTVTFAPDPRFARVLAPRAFPANSPRISRGKFGGGRPWRDANSVLVTAARHAFTHDAAGCLLWIETFGGGAELIADVVRTQAPGDVYARYSRAAANGHRVLAQFLHRHAPSLRAQFAFITAHSLTHRAEDFGHNTPYTRYALEHTVHAGLGLAQKLDPIDQLERAVQLLDPPHAEFALRLAMHGAYSAVANQLTGAAVVSQLGARVAKLPQILSPFDIGAMEKIVSKLARWLPRLFLRSETGLLMAASSRSRKHVNAAVAEILSARAPLSVDGAREKLAAAGNLFAADLIGSALSPLRVSP